MESRHEFDSVTFLLEACSDRVVVAGVDGVPEAEHGVPEAFQEGLSVPEVGGRLFQPLAEPLCVFCGPAVGVGGHEEDADRLTDALNRDGRDDETNTLYIK